MVVVAEEEIDLLRGEDPHSVVRLEVDPVVSLTNCRSLFDF